MKALLLTTLSLGILCPKAHAGAGVVAVSDSDAPLCVAEEPEFRVVRARSADVVDGMKRWLEGQPQTTPELDWANGGAIKFCGESERRAYFEALLEATTASDANERPYVLILLHCRSAALLEMVDAALVKSPEGRAGRMLAKAKALMLFQRKTPEPYPTEKAVRRIAKSLGLTEN